MEADAQRAFTNDRLCCIHKLPDELLLQVFRTLGMIGCDPEDRADHVTDAPGMFTILPPPPHAGLRTYPFLGQVCKRWRDLLGDPTAQRKLWDEVVIDFGQELVTAVHTPKQFGSVRPNDEEFRDAFAKTQISADRIARFVLLRRDCVRRLVLLNCDGYVSDEEDFVSLRLKHDFTGACFGMLLGMVLNQIEEIWVQQCNILFPPGGKALNAIACCSGSLRRLHLIDLGCHMSRDLLSPLGALTLLEELSLGAKEHSEWGHSEPIAMMSLPDSWAKLKRLRRLALRGHRMLRGLPDFLADMPLEALEMSSCHKLIRPGVLSRLTRLHTLVLRDANLASVERDTVGGHHVGCMPDISKLTGLTMLCLASNSLAALPSLSAMHGLVHLDMSSNGDFEVKKPLTQLLQLQHLRYVDLRNIHEEGPMTCWSEQKCATMRFVTMLAKSLKRRKPPGHVLAC